MCRGRCCMLCQYVISTVVIKAKIEFDSHADSCAIVDQYSVIDDIDRQERG